MVSLFEKILVLDVVDGVVDDGRGGGGGGGGGNLRGGGGMGGMAVFGTVDGVSEILSLSTKSRISYLQMGHRDEV